MIHEFGHFIVAKLCGIRVNEFSLGMGPKIISWGKGETKYSWRAFPIGGFVSMEGEDDDSQDPRAFRRKKVWQRLLVVLAGAFMNLVLGFVLLLIISSCSGDLATTTVAVFDAQYDGSAPSHISGLEEGDRIIRVNGMRVFTDTDIAYQFGVDDDGIFEMTVKRNGQTVTLPAVAFEYTVGEDGARNLHVDFSVYGEEATFTSVISYSSRKFVSVARMIWLSLADLVRGRYSINDLSGPVGIVGAIGEVVGDVVGSAQKGVNIGELLANLASFVVFITINVGIFNLLPIPALDGARAVFLIIEGIRRKPIKPEHEGLVHLIGMAALLILMAVVTVSDVIKLF